MLKTKKPTEISWEDLATIGGAACKGKTVSLVECKEPQREWTMKDEYRFPVMEIEYTWLGYLKKFNSREEYEIYCDDKRFLRRMYSIMKELNREYLPIRQDGFLAKAKDFHNKWGNDYVPEDLRCAINSVLEQREQPPLHWFPFEKKEVMAEELQGEVRLIKGEFTPWNGTFANRKGVPVGTCDQYMRWMV